MSAVPEGHRRYLCLAARSMIAPAVHVVWWTGHAEVPARLFWDQAIVVDLLARSRHRLVEHESIDHVPPDEGAVVIVPARFQDGHATGLNAAIAALPWVVVILSSDEEGSFPVADLTHPNLTVWVQYPRVGQPPDARRLPLGPTSDTVPHLAACGDTGDVRDLDWFFAGQITHDRRVAAARAIVGHPNGLLVASSRFAGGLPLDLYYQALATAKIVPAPCGPVHPDSFRLWEALEAGALPIADARATYYDPPDGVAYWPWLLGEEPPFPVVEDWSTLPEVIDDALAGWPGNANRAAAWWQLRKRATARHLDVDISRHLHRFPVTDSWRDLITVVITTSPIPAHPSTDVIDETIRSVRERLPNAEILIAADGIRPDLEHRRAGYDHYLRRLIWACARGRHGRAFPVLADQWGHQALTVKAALELVDTPLVLMLEHDTPLVGDIEWEALTKAVLSGQAEVIRLHHEATILEPHRYLMLDDAPQEVCGAQLLRTAQWSQRPHLADAETYRRLLGTYFGPESRTMIEDCLHGVLANAVDRAGEQGWAETCRTWIYAPGPDMKRSTHLDGRGADSKGEMIFEYPGPTPEGAPRAMSERHP